MRGGGLHEYFYPLFPTFSRACWIALKTANLPGLEPTTHAELSGAGLQ